MIYNVILAIKSKINKVMYVKHSNINFIVILLLLKTLGFMCNLMK
jgi:hypothetical protein